MRKKFSLLLLLAAFIPAIGTGCSTTDPENISERPWNAPKSWETGMPAGMMNQRY